MKAKLLSIVLILTLLCSALLFSCGKKEDDATAGSQGLAYKELKDGKSCTITGIGTCTDTEIKIPEVIDGLKVTSISAAAFAKNTSITSVIVPFGVTTVTANAFIGCTKLSYISLPATLEKVGASAFRDCSALSTVYYEGEAGDWRGVDIGDQNEPLTTASMYYFSEYSPTNAGSYWHYVDGVPTKW